jgi:hypothetical protein
MRWIVPFLLGFTIMWGVLGTKQALSHEWYSAQCCGGKDCHPVDCNEIHSKGNLWEYAGQTIEKWKMQPAPDGQCHVCLHSSLFLCLFMGGGV